LFGHETKGKKKKMGENTCTKASTKKERVGKSIKNRGGSEHPQKKRGGVRVLSMRGTPNPGTPGPSKKGGSRKGKHSTGGGGLKTENKGGLGHQKKKKGNGFQGGGGGPRVKPRNAEVKKGCGIEGLKAWGLKETKKNFKKRGEGRGGCGNEKKSVGNLRQLEKRRGHQGSAGRENGKKGTSQA